MFIFSQEKLLLKNEWEAMQRLVPGVLCGKSGPQAAASAYAPGLCNGSPPWWQSLVKEPSKAPEVKAFPPPKCVTMFKVLS